MRHTGIPIIGDVPWGTHFCQFYQDKQDLLDILVPYFKAGLENNEFCMWVTSEPLCVQEAKAALAGVVADLEGYIRKGQIEFLDYSEWYTAGGKFESDRVLKGWVERLDSALERGFDGLRLTGNTFWLEKSDWQDFTAYEATVDGVIGQYRMLAICTYSLAKCGALEIMDVLSNHAFALIKRAGAWQTIESAERKKAEAALRESEERFRNLFDSMEEGFASCEMIYDGAGQPADFRYLAVNPAFGKLTGLAVEQVVGRTVREVIPEIEPFWIETYGRIVRTGNSERIENRVAALGRNLDLFAWRSGPGQFAVVFSDATERMRAEFERQIAVEFLQLVNQNISKDHLIREAATFFQRRSDCQAVGIRLKEGDDYPYYEARGFPEEFVRMENSLCVRDGSGEIVRDRAGEPVLECMCGSVICGRFDPTKPFFSSGGSFWTNSTTQLLGSTTEADRQGHTRNRCNGQGYESVALIPVRAGGQALGLLQLNDKRKGMFSQESISSWERLAEYFAVALTKVLAQEALRESEAQFRTLANAIPQLCWMANADGWIFWYNQRWYEYTGTTPEQMEGWGWQSVHEPEALPKVLERWKGSIATGEPFDMVFPLRGSDGVFRAFLTRVMPVFDRDGKVARWFGTNTDISEQRKTEEALRESEKLLVADLDAMTRLQKLGTLFVSEGNVGPVLGEIVDAAIAISGADYGNIQLLDPKSAKLEIVAQRGFPKWWLEYWSGVTEGEGVCGTALDRGERVIVEDVEQSPIFVGTTALDIQLRAGVRAVQSTPLISRTGRGLGMFSTHYKTPHVPDDRAFRLLDLLARHAADIIERAQAEEALAASETRLRALLESASQGVVAVDESGRMILVNAKTEEMFGYTRGELLGQPLNILLPESNRDTHAEHMRHYFARPRTRPMGLGLELYGRSKDGNRFPLEISLSCIEQGGSRLAMALITDITERKKAEERLWQAQKLESIGLLAGGVAHDFNNLLVGVMGNASLAREMMEPSHDAVELLDGVIRTGEQLAHLTRQMLAYSGKGRFLVEPLDLSDLLPEMSGLVQPSIPKKIAVHLDLEPHLPLVEADRGQLQQIFMNLVINAAEAIGSNAGLISVKTGIQQVDDAYIRQNAEAADLHPDKYVTLEVRDTGCGMDDATKARIFDPFYSTKFTGRGLGLAAVAGIVRSHKGAIKVTSTPGKGSCFTVFFPAAQGQAAVSTPPSRRAALQGTGTILVVDDEKAVRDLAKKALERYGYKVLVAYSGMAAIDMFKRHPGEISLVILDLSMPEMGGDEALPELRKLRPEVKIIVSSGYSESETLALFRGQSVPGFVQKPYTTTILAEKVKGMLGLL